VLFVKTRRGIFNCMFVRAMSQTCSAPLAVRGSSLSLFLKRRRIPGCLTSRHASMDLRHARGVEFAVLLILEIIYFS